MLLVSLLLPSIWLYLLQSWTSRRKRVQMLPITHTSRSFLQERLFHTQNSAKKKQLLQFRAGQIPTDYTKVLLHARFTDEHSNSRSDPRHGTGHSSLPPAILVHSHWQPWGCCLQL